MKLSTLIKHLVALKVFPPKSGGGASGWSDAETTLVPAGTEFSITGIPADANEVSLCIDYTRASSANIGPDISAIVDGVVSADTTNFAFAAATFSTSAQNVSGGGTSSTFTPGSSTGTVLVGEIRFTRITGNKWAIAVQIGANGFWVGCGAGVARLQGNLTGFQFKSRVGADFIDGAVTLRYRT